MTWYHPSYYKKLRDLRRQASGNGRVGPRASSLKKNKTLDRCGDMGYSGTNNETLTYEQLNASRPRTVANEKKKAQHALGTGGHGTGFKINLQADKQQAGGHGRVGPEGTGDQASGDSRINKR